jgi:serine-type D-Ala-D-Ala carboxypeptidase/endopeptidase (penicillin-binding protein 4)
MSSRNSIAVFSLFLLLCWSGAAEANDKKRSSHRARSAIKRTTRTIAPDALRRDRAKATTPAPEDRLREELEGIWAGRILRRGVTAIYVVDARTGEPLYAVRADDKLNPASNVKLLSTATVLDLLGPSWRYLTRVYGPAPDGNGVARGSVYLRGSADPTLTASHLDELARAAAASGLTKVDGDVILSEDLLRDTLSSPRIQIRVQAGAPGKAPTVTVEPRTSYIQVQVTATTTRARRAGLSVATELLEAPEVPEGAAEQPDHGPRLLVKVGGTIRAGRTQSHQRSVRLRSTFTGHLLRSALRAAGVEVTGRVRLGEFDEFASAAAEAGWLPVELARHSSRTIQELVAVVNKRSTNWLADRLLMTAGAEAAGVDRPSMELGLAAMDGWLERAGINPGAVVVDTGSGLSRRTQLTARHIVNVLRAAAGYTSELSPGSLLDPAIFLHSLAVGGVDGTLRGRFRAETLRGRVLGKTGTLRDSVALSGFVAGEGDDVLCFSIVTNGNTWGARGGIRREHDLMVGAMQRYLQGRAARVARRAEVEATQASFQASPDAAVADDGADLASDDELSDAAQLEP